MGNSKSNCKVLTKTKLNTDIVVTKTKLNTDRIIEKHEFYRNTKFFIWTNNYEEDTDTYDDTYKDGLNISKKCKFCVWTADNMKKKYILVLLYK